MVQPKEDLVSAKFAQWRFVLVLDDLIRAFAAKSSPNDFLTSLKSLQWLVMLSDVFYLRNMLS